MIPIRVHLMGNITCNTVKTLKPPAIRLGNTEILKFSQHLVASQYFCDEMLATTRCGNALYKRAKKPELLGSASHYNFPSMLSITTLCYGDAVTQAQTNRQT